MKFHTFIIYHTLCYLDTPIHHIQAFQVRCHSRKQVGDYGAAIDDATEALAMIQSRKNMVDRPEFPVQKMEARLLFDRGDVLLKNAGWGEAKLTSIAKDAFDAGLRDIRAALAVARASRQWWRNREAGDIIDIDEVSALFICVMATKKVQSGATRPFYSAQSLVSFCKDACVGPYSFERHVCLGCGAAPTDGTGLQTKPVELRTCDKCLQFWFCSKECLSKTWKSIHKPLCKPDNAFGGRGKLAYWYVSDFEKNFIDDKIDTFGAFCVPRAKRDKDDSSSLAESHEQDLPFAICRDANGLYFDQFTDHPFIFLPSQATRMFEVGVSVDKSYDLMLDSVGYLTNLSQTMTARQKSNFRKLTMKHMRLRNQARKYPDVAAKLADQMRMLSTMQE